ncbi:hypothetical protein F4804DRAFT_293486 [Jackrogersella minutella]|nr:hypothetical protein F4804DRAFT_293486 [Jackrogersella minutella]
MLDKLSLCQRALGPDFKGEQQLIAAVHRECRNVPQLQHALFEPSTRFEDLASKLRASIGTHENLKGARQFLMDDDSDDEIEPIRACCFQPPGVPDWWNSGCDEVGEGVGIFCVASSSVDALPHLSIPQAGS